MNEAYLNLQLIYLGLTTPFPLPKWNKNPNFFDKND